MNFSNKQLVILREYDSYIEGIEDAKKGLIRTTMETSYHQNVAYNYGIEDYHNNNVIGKDGKKINKGA